LVSSIPVELRRPIRKSTPNFQKTESRTIAAK
jgi:hypothetical protein